MRGLNQDTAPCFLRVSLGLPPGSGTLPGLAQSCQELSYVTIIITSATIDLCWPHARPPRGAPPSRLMTALRLTLGRAAGKWWGPCSGGGADFAS